MWNIGVPCSVLTTVPNTHRCVCALNNHFLAFFLCDGMGLDWDHCPPRQYKALVNSLLLKSQPLKKTQENKKEERVRNKHTKGSSLWSWLSLFLCQSSETFLSFSLEEAGGDPRIVKAMRASLTPIPGLCHSLMWPHSASSHSSKLDFYPSRRSSVSESLDLLTSPFLGGDSFPCDLHFLVDPRQVIHFQIV